MKLKASDWRDTGAMLLTSRPAAQVRAISVALLVALFPITARAVDSPRLQVFVQLEGTVPDWTRMDLSISQLQIGGIDPAGKRFLITAFSGSQALSIPRDAASSPRFLISGSSAVGSVDRILLTVQSASLTTRGTGGTSPKKVPITVQDNPLKLRPSTPFSLANDQTRSVYTVIRLGKDAVLTARGTVALNSTLLANLFTPSGPENYLTGNEVLIRSPDTDLPELGIRALRSKARDTVTGAIRDLTLRSDDKSIASYLNLRTTDETLWRSDHGVLHRRFHERLATLDASTVVAATLLVRHVGPLTLNVQPDTPQAWQVAHADFLAARQAAAAPVIAALEDALTGAGATIVSSSLDPPAVGITATRGTIEALAKTLTSVVQIVETPGVAAVMATNSAADLVSEPLQLTGAGGPGIVVGLVDAGPCVDTQHEAFVSMTIKNPDQDCDPTVGATSDTASAGHSTGVAGALGATVPETFEGDNYHIGVHARPPAGYSGLYAGTIIGYNVCHGVPLHEDIHLGSISCIQAVTNGGPRSMLRQFLDDAVYMHRIFVVNGSGNIGNGYLVGDYRESAFCNSYNSVCVGGYGHKFTVGVGKFGDDEPSGGWENFDDREKPDLMGPFCSVLPDALSDGVFQLEHKDWSTVKFCGTSFAAPTIAGFAGILMASYNQLIGDPTLVRAVLMASASHGLPGYPRVPIYSDNVDDRGGAGAPRGDRAQAIMDNGQYLTKNVNYDTDFDSNGNFTTPITFDMKKDDIARIVLTYDQCQAGTISVADSLIADLDLSVTEDSMSPVVTSLSNNSHYDNTEILEFEVRNAARVHVFVRAQHWEPCGDGRKTYMAVAWDVHPGPGPIIGD